MDARALEKAWDDFCAKADALVPEPPALEGITPEELARSFVRRHMFVQELPFFLSTIGSGRRIESASVEHIVKVAQFTEDEATRFRALAKLLNEHAELVRAKEQPSWKHGRYMRGFEEGARNYGGMAGNEGIEYEIGYKDGGLAREAASKAFAASIGYELPARRPVAETGTASEGKAACPDGYAWTGEKCEPEATP